MQTLWLSDGKIKKTTVRGKPKFTMEIPEAFIRAVGEAACEVVSIYLDNNNLKVVPHEFSQDA